MKPALYQYCIEHVQQRLHRIQKTIANPEESLSSETKSSAGDKHETGRAMVQLEREKAGMQLAEVQKLEKILHKINPTNTSSIICLGSLVTTNKAKYYMAISAGAIILENITYYAIGIHTPVGKKLLGKKTGDQITFNHSTFQIENVS